MMFNNEKAIYLQIADRLCDEILSGTYAEDERIPSVREYAVLLEVNINTTVKSFDQLATAGIIYNRRGLGYFVSKGAREQIMAERKKDFMEQRLPELFRNMRMLNIDIEDVVKAYNDSHKDC
ncbi:MAG: GntR family transcriptional regulator [Prevotella sp.]|nr:GntR family transcriptional regulator [Prevotella sp.]MBQ4633292.1 GntR family transcriptional regulator [Prevotella sp.]MBQ5606219.1 GntR family transcriptional regulator [Prevotella sp.]MBQ8629830.1 GntR family transcriptional regulator [Prevotella sp.]MEE1092048.1 GntR family transcriptional regulator [Prevotella sp.]